MTAVAGGTAGEVGIDDLLVLNPGELVEVVQKALDARRWGRRGPLRRGNSDIVGHGKSRVGVDRLNS